MLRSLVSENTWTVQADGLREGFEDAETVYVGLETVADDVGKTFFFGVHDHDGQGDAAPAEFDAFVAIGDGEVVGVVVLEGVGNLGGAGAGGGGLDHGHEFGGGTDEGSVVVEVGDEVVEVYLHDGLVRLALQGLGDVFEMETTRALKEYGGIGEVVEGVLTEALFGCGVEGGGDGGKEGFVATECLANADKVVNAVREDELGCLRIKFGFGDAGLEYVAHD